MPICIQQPRGLIFTSSKLMLVHILPNRVCFVLKQRKDVIYGLTWWISFFTFFSWSCLLFEDFSASADRHCSLSSLSARSSSILSKLSVLIWSSFCLLWTSWFILCSTSCSKCSCAGQGTNYVKVNCNVREDIFNAINFSQKCISNLN